MPRIIVPVRRGYGGSVLDENPVLGRKPWSPPRRQRGRPRADAKAARITELRAQNKSWRSVDELIEAEFPGTNPDASRRLYRSRKRTVGIRKNGKLEQAFLQLVQTMQPRDLHVPKRRGRRRLDEIRFEAWRMKKQGKSLPEIRIELNAKYKQNRSLDSYRKLCSFPKYEGPPRKLDLNIIRGK